MHSQEAVLKKSVQATVDVTRGVLSDSEAAPQQPPGSPGGAEARGAGGMCRVVQGAQDAGRQWCRGTYSCAVLIPSFIP